MDARDKLNEFAEMTGMNKNQLIGWSIAADFAEWYAEQKALSRPPVIDSIANAIGRNCPFCGEPCPECSHKGINEFEKI